jgi:hypothetical protein
MARFGGWTLMRLRHIAGAISVAYSCASAAMAAGPSTSMEEFMVPAGDPGIELYVRNKHPQGVKKF